MIFVLSSWTEFVIESHILAPQQLQIVEASNLSWSYYGLYPLKYCLAFFHCRCHLLLKHSPGSSCIKASG